MKILTYSLILFLSISTGTAQTADVLMTYSDGKTSKKNVPLEKLEDGSLRLKISKSEIPGDVKYFEVFTDFAVAQKGDKGYAVYDRGLLSEFTRDKGKYIGFHTPLPIFGMISPKASFWGIFSGMRFETIPIFEIQNGVHRLGVRCKVGDSGFGAYDDFVVEYHFLDADAASYVGIGKAYRKYLLERNIVKPLKERIKTSPNLEYIAYSVPIRFHYHGGKNRFPQDFTPENEPPLNVYFTFEDAKKFADECKAVGIDKISFCSAGFQSGGYDGKDPDVFPIPAEYGGEAALKDMISHIKELGYNIHAHTNSTDCYTCSTRWKDGIVAKNPDGTPQRGGVWCGGKSYHLCLKNAWDTFLKGDLEKVRGLGFDGMHYLDVFSATIPYYCADPKHPANREEVAKIQREIAAYCKGKFGGFASEAGFDHIAGYLDYVNYVANRITPYEEMKKNGEMKGNYAYVDKIVPLWEIVYHGIILSNPDRYTQNHTLGKPKTSSHDSDDVRFMFRDGVENIDSRLKLMEFGGRPIFYSMSAKDIPLIKKAYDQFLPVRYLQMEFMEDHREISNGVFATVYSDGSEIVTNYSQTPFEYKGQSVPSRDFKLFKAEKKIEAKK